MVMVSMHGGVMMRTMVMMNNVVLQAVLMGCDSAVLTRWLRLSCSDDSPTIA